MSLPFEGFVYPESKILGTFFLLKFTIELKVGRNIMPLSLLDCYNYVKLYIELFNLLQ